ncbi:MAG: alanine--tRNA ligase [Thaumarchaeota archaeon]|nr:alanine--tRNA ligase [Nitrososphaerota archaeon]
MKEKDALRQKFSSEPDKYYKVALFEREGFTRRQCASCGKFFWTLDPNRKVCAEQPCQYYEFLGNPPTPIRLDYIETWKRVEEFFVKNGHTSVRRYPVVCRWRPDLFFTVASIIDFQRIEGGKVVFEVPANPLIVPQMCLRFNDIQNVGVSGRHYTSFCMIGQAAIANSEGYWKDRCIDLDYDMLTQVLKIPKEEIVFLEDVWVGYGAFGYSLEYHARGLELGNAVFTAFEGTIDDHKEMPEKVIDMGAGLERFTWITQGTPTSYDCVFGPVIPRMLKELGVEYDEDFFMQYAKIAGTVNVDETPDIRAAKTKVAQSLGVSLEELEKKVKPLEAIYAVADHARTLAFAIADGGLPSNVGGGYNLRVIYRRAIDFLNEFKWKLKLEDVAKWHVDYLRPIYPELDEHKNDIEIILGVEEKRYQSTRERIGKLATTLQKSTTPLGEEDLIRLYDSEGVTPEMLVKHGLQIAIPQDFYAKVTARHVVPKKMVETYKFDVDGLAPTRLLFYEDQNLFDFQAKILKVFEGRFIILDGTSFYARSGGQEPDIGKIEDFEVVNVEKYGHVVVHELKNPPPFTEGQTVNCSVDRHRRGILMRHHTATHVLNGAARKLLGPWVWQHSAYKDIDKARLDVTHYAHLTREDIQKLEEMANEIVIKNVPVIKEILPRGEAENKYGFTIYQGGVVPGKEVRIQNISGWDVEACGGTHCTRTGDIGFIKILKAERVQDGIERLEFVAGEVALKQIQSQAQTVSELSQRLGAPQDKIVESVNNSLTHLENLKKQQRTLMKRVSSALAKEIASSATSIDGVKIHVSPDVDLDDEYQIALGEQAVNVNPEMVYAAFLPRNGRVRVLIFSGKDAQKRGVHAGNATKEIAKLVGGSGGGDAAFGQGGGTIVDKIDEAKKSLLTYVKNTLDRQK